MQSAPVISVIMPVYNAAAYLQDAIESVIKQSFENFELILINDGSTDQSMDIIHQFNDQRIVLLDNECNRGLIFSLNRAIAQARGKYIARMDADDLCLSFRLQDQFTYMENNPNISVLAGFIDFINEYGAPKGLWPLDRKAINPHSIKKYMVSACCIAHPSIMARTEIMQQYPYSNQQKAIEDYDLWLRLLADGFQIDKLNKSILQYRVHENSVTQADNLHNNVYFKIARCKRRFLAIAWRKGKINSFTLLVFLRMLVDYSLGIGKQIKKMFKY